MRLVARGDQGAFEVLYRRTAPWLTVRLRRRCADEQIVAEVLQETFVAVWRAAGSFAGAAVEGSAVGWLWTIAARRLVDAFRRRARQPVLAAAPALGDLAPKVATIGESARSGLFALPAGEQTRRVAALRQAGLTCQGNQLDILTRGTAG